MLTRKRLSFVWLACTALTVLLLFPNQVDANCVCERDQPMWEGVERQHCCNHVWSGNEDGCDWHGDPKGCDYQNFGKAKDDTKYKIDEENALRNTLTVNSPVKFYDKDAQQWIKGTVTVPYKDHQSEYWLEVSYNLDGQSYVKDIDRYSENLRPIKPDESAKPKSDGGSSCACQIPDSDLQQASWTQCCNHILNHGNTAHCRWTPGGCHTWGSDYHESVAKEFHIDPKWLLVELTEHSKKPNADRALFARRIARQKLKMKEIKKAEDEEARVKALIPLYKKAVDNAQAIGYKMDIVDKEEEKEAQEFFNAHKMKFRDGGRYWNYKIRGAQIGLDDLNPLPRPPAKYLDDPKKLAAKKASEQHYGDTIYDPIGDQESTPPVGQFEFAAFCAVAFVMTCIIWAVCAFCFGAVGGFIIGSWPWNFEKKTIAAMSVENEV